MNKCSRCKVEKYFGDFSKNKSRKDGLSNVCKACSKEVAKEWRKENSFDGRVVANKKCSACSVTYLSSKFYNDKSRADGLSNKCIVCVKIYRKNNRDKLLEQSRKYNKKNAEGEKVEVTGRVCAQCKEFKDKDCFWKSKHTKDGLYSCCIDCKKELESTEHRQAVRKKNQKDWNRYPENKKRSLKTWNNWDKNKRATDPAYKLRRNVMHAICSKIQGRSFEREAGLQRAIFDHLPYTSEELKSHIESQWESWMTWENYGLYDKHKDTWQIDHIVPQSSLLYSDFNDENFLICWSLNNLRPLETVANIKKSNNEIPCLN